MDIHTVWCFFGFKPGLNEHQIRIEGSDDVLSSGSTDIMGKE